MPQSQEPAEIRVGLCQTYTVEWDVEGNFTRVLADLETAARQGAELIITPECVLNGYAGPGPDDWKARFPATTAQIEGPQITQVRAFAAQKGVEIVFGFAECDDAGRYFNTAVLIGRSGEIVYAYRKTHCRPFESNAQNGMFTPGDEFFVAERTFESGNFRIGTIICFDREIVESVRCLRALGAEFIACPLATNTTSLTAPVTRADNELITRARAAENEVYIAVINHAGRFNGGSYIVGPFGETIIQLGAEPEVQTVTIPLGSVSQRFHSKPLGWMGWGYRRPDLYARYCGPTLTPHPQAGTRPLS